MYFKLDLGQFDGSYDNTKYVRDNQRRSLQIRQQENAIHRNYGIMPKSRNLIFFSVTTFSM